MPVTVPCGRCIGCRLERSRQWAIRCVHEASLWEHNSFITLTYDDDHMPIGGTLVKEHFQKFMKRLRFLHTGKTIRYFHCGEYGETTHRPHYHACLFNHHFADRILYSSTRGNNLYISKELSTLWTYGFSTVGEVTFESAAYVARYIMKKVTGERAADHYQTLDPITGEIHQILPEYTTMSRNKGLGQQWYQKYKNDAYPDDFLIVRGKKMRPPKYYDSIYEQEEPKAHQALKKQRKKIASVHKSDNTSQRLATKEKVASSKLSQLKRSI